jgi:hypothetical protein
MINVGKTELWTKKLFQVSGDETKGDIPLRRRDDVIERRKKRRERFRKNRKKQKLMAQLAKIETELDVYDGNLDFTDDVDNNNNNNVGNKDKINNSDANDEFYNYELNYPNYDELLNLNLNVSFQTNQSYKLFSMT